MSRYLNPYTDFGFKKLFGSLLTNIEVKEVIKTAKDDGKREVAKEMKEDGVAIEKIVKYTGLSKEEIEEL
ncbi:MAG TPA: hypothetical protein DCR35_10955 [Runella sp.]|nr:hypothetical protein [Runella sp.]HAO49774.1 hypothetical protein [Runella sp.]